MTARLHVLLGAGGVGKTTLAAGYALALARAGPRVGLLGIDPARRLQSALGQSLGDVEAPVPGEPNLRAALLRPADCLRRWAREACTDDEARARLETNAFFLAMADRLAGATDVLAAVRIAEWAEHDAALEHLVIDTAPGLNAVEFLERPQLLLTFLEGRLVTWLRWLARSQQGRLGAIVRSGTAALGGLVRLGGTKLLFELADFLVLVEPVLERMIDRLEAAQAWLRRADSELLLISAVRSEALHTLSELSAALEATGVHPSRVVLNRALPEGLAAELARYEGAALSAEDALVVRYALGAARVQDALLTRLRARFEPLTVVPLAAGLDAADRLDALAALGARLTTPNSEPLTPVRSGQTRPAPHFST